MQNTTPNQSVKMLLASGDVKRVGEESVGDDRRPHYSGKVDWRLHRQEPELADQKQLRISSA